MLPDNSILARSAKSPLKALAGALSGDLTTQHLSSNILSLLLIAVILGICLLQFALGTLPTRIYAVDLFILLDGAWRVAYGQIPHLDFYSGLGILVWKPTQLALSMSGFNAEALGLARAFHTAVIGLWAMAVLRPRVSMLELLVLTLFIVLVVSAARPFGEGLTLISHAMYYNRIGYALLFLIILDVFYLSGFRAALTGGDTARGFALGMSTGIAFGCIALLKISFVLPAAMLIVAGVILFGLQRRHFLGALTGGLVVLGTAMLLMDFRPVPFVAEMMQLGLMRGDTLSGRLHSVFREEMRTVLYVGIASLCAGVLVFPRLGQLSRYLVASGVVLATDLYCRATNAMGGDLPVASLWCLLAAGLLFVSSRVDRDRPALGVRAYGWAAVSLLILYPLTAPTVLKDAGSIAYAAYLSRKPAAADSPRIDSDRLRQWVTFEWDGDPIFRNSNGPRLVAITNDGLRLLRERTSSDETVSTISFANRFSYALGRRPPLGGAPWLHLENNFNLQHPLPFDVLVGRGDVLMVQKYPSPDGSTAILSMYPDVLATEYSLVGSSQYWTLYRRKRS